MDQPQHEIDVIPTKSNRTQSKTQ